jgi:hypothetical protein
MPVIPITQEVEISMIMVQDSIQKIIKAEKELETWLKW